MGTAWSWLASDWAALPPSPRSGPHGGQRTAIHTGCSGGPDLPGPEVGVGSTLPEEDCAGGQLPGGLLGSTPSVFRAVPGDWAFSPLHFPCSKWHWFLPSHRNPVLEDLLGSSSSLTPSLFTSSVSSIFPPGASPSCPAPSLGTCELHRLSASFLQEGCSNVLFYLPASPQPPILQATTRGNLQTCSLMSSLYSKFFKVALDKLSSCHFLRFPPAPVSLDFFPWELAKPLSSPGPLLLPSIRCTLSCSPLCGWSSLAFGAQLCAADWTFLTTLSKASLPPTLTSMDAPAHGLQSTYHNPSLLAGFFSFLFKDVPPPEPSRVPET